MSEAIILGVIQKLESLVVEMPEHKNIMEEVIDELKMMMEFLRDKEPGERSKLNNLLADFAGLAASIVSSIYEFLYYVYDGVPGNGPRDQFREIKKRMMELEVGEEPSKEQSVGDKGIVVGLEKDVQRLVSRVILRENSERLTSCIKGMIGSGKTTLARQVYDHPAIIEKFKHRAWISLFKGSSMREVYVGLLQQLVESDGDSLLLEEMDNHSLIHMLHQHIKGMIPYFIVVDNLPQGVRFFETFFFRTLPRGHGCRLLFTSRYLINEEFFYTHEMKSLDSDQSWQLFINKIDKFTSSENKFSKELERKGREMLKKCWGLPIAIIDVARQKAKQRLLGREWEELFDSIDFGEILKFLEPMYQELDEEMKPYFLHMSLFKENVIMRQEKLEQIWAASGLNTQSFAYGLYRQSIIEVVHPYPPKYEVKRCRIHPLLHMLSIMKAEEEMGLEILSFNGNNRPSQNPCHRVLQCGREKLNHSHNQDKHLVSLILHGGGRYLNDVSPSYWESFEQLKILDMDDFGVKILSDFIGTLIGLRYMGLRNNYIQKIPPSLGGLKKLEVLDIALNFMVEVPDIIKEMSSLHHLYMSDVICPKPLEIDALENLETLTYISIHDWKYEVSGLKKMTQFIKLGIKEVDENSDVSRLFASLTQFNGLRHLILRGFRLRSMPCLEGIGVLCWLSELKLDGLLSRLPSADNLRHIKYLTLVNTCLDEDPMPILEKLSCLCRLKLQNAYIGREMIIQPNGFPELQVLRINELWNLSKIQVGEGAMSGLGQLEIMNCPHVENLPEECESMKYLKKFKMVTTKDIARKIRNLDIISKIVEVDISP
ncbi:probable disease resistance protein At1g58602 [Salvia hispanica]|uniref:probable disease resistance protein At1g58602 n=1 Tax=Salvia hispanica TaxID=49212 RepID=UPI002009424F|nr:probable disease resistance protein At1g58602 [Salvia hispanica]